MIRTSSLPQLLKGDTIIVSGGPRDAILAAVSDRKLARFLLRARAVGARIASVCSGAFVHSQPRACSMV